MLSITYNSRMVDALKRSIKKRLTTYEDQDKFKFATTLDPRFKLKWCLNEDEREDIKIKLLQGMAKEREECVLTDSSKNDGMASTPSSDPVNPPSAKKKSSQLLQFIFENTDTSAETSQSDSMKAEVTSYLTDFCIAEKDNLLEYWTKNASLYPTLAALAKYYLSIPALSGRLFSIGGKFFRPDRCRLTDEKFKKLMNIKCNGHL